MDPLPVQKLSHLLGPTLGRRLFTARIKDEKGNEMLVSGIGPFLESLYIGDTNGNQLKTQTLMCKIFTESASSRTRDGKFLDSTVRGVVELIGFDLLLAWNFDQFSVFGKEELRTGNRVICAGRSCTFGERKEILDLKAIGKNKLLIATTSGVEFVTLHRDKKERLTYASQLFRLDASLDGLVITCAWINIDRFEGHQHLRKNLDIILGLSDGRLFNMTDVTTRFLTVSPSPKSRVLDLCLTRRHVVVLFEKHITVYSSMNVQTVEDKYDIMHTMPNPGLYKIVSDLDAVIYGLKRGSSHLYVLRDFTDEEAVFSKINSINSTCFTESNGPLDMSKFPEALSDQISKIHTNGPDMSKFVETLTDQISKVDFQVLAPVESSFGDISCVNCIRNANGDSRMLVIGGSAGGWSVVEGPKVHSSNPETIFTNTFLDIQVNYKKSNQWKWKQNGLLLREPPLEAKIGYVFSFKGLPVLLETNSGIMVYTKDPFTRLPFMKCVTRIYIPSSNNRNCVFFAVGKEENYLVDYEGPNPVVQAVSKESHPFEWVGFAGKEVMFFYKRKLSIFEFDLKEPLVQFPLKEVDIRSPIIAGIVGDERQKVVVLANGTNYFVIDYRKNQIDQHPIFSADQQKVFGKKKEMPIVDMITNKDGFVLLLNNGGILTYRSDFSKYGADSLPIFTLSEMRFVDSLANATSLLTDGKDTYAFGVKNSKDSAEITLYSVESSKFILSENIGFNITEESHQLAVDFTKTNRITLSLFHNMRFVALEFKKRKTFHFSDYAYYNGTINGLSVCSMSERNSKKSYGQTVMAVAVGDSIQIGILSHATKKLTIRGRYQLRGSTFSAPFLRLTEMKSDLTFGGTISALNDKFGVYTVGFECRMDENAEIMFNELPENSIPLDDTAECSLLHYDHEIPTEDGELSVIIDKESMETRSLSWASEGRSRPQLVESFDNQTMIDFIALDKCRIILIVVYFEKGRIMGKTTLCKATRRGKMTKQCLESRATTMESPIFGCTTKLSKIRHNGYTFYGVVADAKGGVYLVTGEGDPVQLHGATKDSPPMCWRAHKLPFDPIKSRQDFKIHLLHDHPIQHNDGPPCIRMTIYRYICGENCVRYIELDCVLKGNEENGTVENCSPERRIFVGHSTSREGGLLYQPMENGILVYEDGVRVHFKCDCEGEERAP